MFIDLRNVPGGTLIDADVCIAGGSDAHRRNLSCHGVNEADAAEFQAEDIPAICSLFINNGE